MFSYKGKVISATQGMLGTPIDCPCMKGFHRHLRKLIAARQYFAWPTGGLPSRFTSVSMAGDLPVPTLRLQFLGNGNHLQVLCVLRFRRCGNTTAQWATSQQGLPLGHTVLLRSKWGRVGWVYRAWPSVSSGYTQLIGITSALSRTHGTPFGHSRSPAVESMCRRWWLLKKEEIRVLGDAKTNISPPQRSGILKVQSYFMLSYLVFCLRQLNLWDNFWLHLRFLGTSEKVARLQN